MFLFKRSNGIWYFYFNQPDGKRKAVSTRETQKSDALKFMKNFNTDAHPATPKVVLLSDLQTQIINYVQNNLSFDSYRVYVQCFKNLNSTFGNINIKQLTSKMFEDYKEHRLQTVKKVSVNIEIRTIKAIFSRAVKWGMVDKNPLQNVKQFRLEQREPIAFSDEEINLLISSIQNTDILNIVKFGLWTGCRLNEILNLQWKDIDLNKRLIRVGNKEDFQTKSRKIRYIPVSDKLYSILCGFSFSNPDSYLFQKHGYKYQKNYVSKAFKKYLRACSLPEKYHFHSLRHSFVTKLIKNDVNINFVKELAGHSNLSTTLNYVHISTNDLRHAVNSL